ncbi:Alpha/Beta hydrolase protein [Mariannaea sp. PMI_226]|nr:Alpha/Beta hydrolase protein [Mariannaea sp. PMI_226]
MSVQSCCLKGFKWEGSPTGHIEKLDNLNVYVSGENKDAAILVIHDLLGWSFPNVRLLADHYSQEANATVYVPDFFDGEVLPFDLLCDEKWGEIDLAGFMARNSRDIREPQIIGCARALREKHGKLAAIGFCYGGWAVFRIGAKEHQPPIVDCVTAGHPSLLTKADIDGIGVPVQMLAPEIDPVYTAELKMHTFQTLQASGIPFDYQHFPGVAHACLVRGDEKRPGERAAMVRGKNMAVSWMKQYLHK